MRRLGTAAVILSMATLAYVSLETVEAQDTPVPKPSLVHYRGECRETLDGTVKVSGACTIMVQCQHQGEHEYCFTRATGVGADSLATLRRFRKNGDKLTLDQEKPNDGVSGNGTLTDSEVTATITSNASPTSGGKVLVATLSGKFQRKIY